MNLLKITCSSGGSALDVRSFAITEGVSTLFSVEVTVRSDNPELDLGRIVGHPAALQLTTGNDKAFGDKRVWSGVCASATQLQAETAGVSTYSLRIVPSLWILTQRTNQRIFQHRSIVEIVTTLLTEWGITHRWNVERARYPKLDFKVQYAETDYAFFCRLLEEAGIAFAFEEHAKSGSTLLLGDALQAAKPRSAPPLVFMDNPNMEAGVEYVTKVRLSHEVRPGAATIADYDFRHPGRKLIRSAPAAGKPEGGYEQYRYQPASTLAETSAQGDTPVADDQGTARHLAERGDSRATRELEAHRSGRERVSFETNAVELRPGTIFAMDYEHPELSSKAQLLVVGFELSGTHNDEWRMAGVAVFADRPYRPAIKTPKPHLEGVQSATVVGPAGEEIHTDEFGRVRVHFPWDRDGTVNERSSCWIRVSQAWAGTKYGMINLPRIGQEALVSFLDGDPDRPVVVGRVFNSANPVPYALPDNKTISAQKSNASLGSNGFNELKYEDKKGEELVYVQAEKNMRQFVAEDDTATVQHDRFKLVKNDYRDTIENHREQVINRDRFESTEGHRAVCINGDRRQQVEVDENDRTDGFFQCAYRIDHDLVVQRNRRELIQQEHHRIIEGARRAATEGRHSVAIGGELHERVMGRQAVSVGQTFSIRCGGNFVAEGIEDITFKTAGGFIRINSGGLTIRGTQVKINSGGAAGPGLASSPDAPLVATEAAFQISPQRVQAIVSIAEKHGVTVPATLTSSNVQGIDQIALSEHKLARSAAHVARAARATTAEDSTDALARAAAAVARETKD